MPKNKAHTVEKRVGRPPSGQRKIRSFRITPDLLERLAVAAAQNTRSVSLEIETRLEKTFSDADAVAKYFGGEDMVILAKLVTATVQAIPGSETARWNANPALLRATKDALSVLLDNLAAGAAYDGCASVIAKQRAHDVMRDRYENAHKRDDHGLIGASGPLEGVDPASLAELAEAR